LIQKPGTISEGREGQAVCIGGHAVGAWADISLGRNQGIRWYNSATKEKRNLKNQISVEKHVLVVLSILFVLFVLVVLFILVI
jgi:hypothetical protein